jgi:hypothetical protein
LIENPLEDYEGFFKEIQEESPRSAVIISAAFINAQLRKLLLNSLVCDGKISENFLGRELSHFNSRIKLCYCLGLIEKNIYDDLCLIQRIRNKFAHEMHGYSFDSPEIKEMCHQFDLANNLPVLEKQLKKGENAFLIEISMITMRLGLKIVGSEKG